jgi:hypothetical protein
MAELDIENKTVINEINSLIRIVDFPPVCVPFILARKSNTCGFLVDGKECNQPATFTIGEHENVACNVHAVDMDMHHIQYKSESGRIQWQLRVDILYIFPSILDYGHIHYITHLENEYKEQINEDEHFKICPCGNITTYREKKRFMGKICFDCYKIVVNMYPAVKLHNDNIVPGWNSIGTLKFAYISRVWKIVHGDDIIEFDEEKKELILNIVQIVLVPNTECGW